MNCPLDPALNTALSYVQSVIDTVRDPLLVLDETLRVQTASRNFRRTFEVSAEETEGRLVYELGNGQWDIPRLRELLEVILPQHTELNGFEVEHEFPQIGHRFMLLNARKIWREANHTRLILLAIEDITERKKHEKQIAYAQVQLKRSNEDLEQFARIAAHDLRAPLMGMIQAAQLIERRNGESDFPSDEWLSLIVSNGKRLTELLDDMMRYATVDHTPMTAEKPVEAFRACAQAAANLRTEIEATKARIHCSGREDVKVRLPFSLLMQVFQNLMSNAIHYSRDGVTSVVEITAAPEKAYWLFNVQDNGLGIEKQWQEMIFEPFRRLHGHDRPGSGIGLATCRRVVERAGGRIWVDSVAGEGSTFKFLLPMA